MKTYTVVTNDGEVVAIVSREERNRLLGLTEEGTAVGYSAPEMPLWPNGAPIYNPKLIRVHKRNHLLYYSLVDPSVIRAELRREISQRIPVAEDNTTIRRCAYAADNGTPVRYFEHHEARSFAYATTQSSAQERNERRLFREKRATVKVIPFPRAPYIPKTTAA